MEPIPVLNIASQHNQMVMDLIKCTPGSERARELRVMVRRLEEIDPSLEQQRITAMTDYLAVYLCFRTA